MNEQKFIYKEGNNFTSIYSNDILINNQANNTRIYFLDTRLPMPESSTLSKDGCYNIKYNEDKIMEKINKCEVIIPTELIPNIIESLNIAYKNYKDFKNSKED